MAKKNVFSGVAPSGVIHLGNYLGSINKWLGLQNKYKCFFCIVDQHAVTLPQDPEKLQKKIWEVATIYLAAGIDPMKSIIFIQSHVPEHTELCWILNTIAKIPELKLMTQFKERSKEHPREVNVGLFDYPILMAADILLYQADLVPVGEDQKQHVELTRTLARRFNHIFGQTFTIPQALIRKEGARIMGLDNPLKKMSKSARNPYNYIALTDSPDLIREKIKKAVTDSGREIKFNPVKKPAISNLLTIYSLISGLTIKEIEKHYFNKGYADFKADLAERIVNFLIPFQERYRDFESQPKYLEKIFKQGRDKAGKIAKITIQKVKEKMGFVIFD